MEVNCQLHAPVSLLPGKEPLVPIGGPQSGLDALVKGKIPAPAGTRTPDHPAQRTRQNTLKTMYNVRLGTVQTISNKQVTKLQNKDI